jgi:hypothetical protein
MAKNVTGSITSEEYQELLEKYTAGPDKYTKPIRIYVDVDGVIMPFINSQEDLDALDGRDTITITNGHSIFYGDAVELDTGLFVYNKFVAEKLSEWSHRDDVDFIWLTSWRVNAPYALDAILNINSVGYLPWDRRRSDYNHAFKRVAIENEQKVSPSKFIWLDDFANKQMYKDIPVFTRGYYEGHFERTPNGEFNEFTGSWEQDYIQGDFIVEKEFIAPEQYLSITTDSYVGLSQENIAVIDAWLDQQ